MLSNSVLVVNWCVCRIICRFCDPAERCSCLFITKARNTHIYAPKVSNSILIITNISHLVLFKLLRVVFRRELEGAAVVGVVEKRRRQVLKRNRKSAAGARHIKRKIKYIGGRAKGARTQFGQNQKLPRSYRWKGSPLAAACSPAVESQFLSAPCWAAGKSKSLTGPCADKGHSCCDIVVHPRGERGVYKM